MSVIRHPQMFERKISPDGSRRWFRSSGGSEKVLLIADGEMVRAIQRTLHENFFEVRVADALATSLRVLRDEKHDFIILDTALSGFPVDLFLFAVDKLSPWLADRIIFLVGAGLQSKWANLIERRGGLKIWRRLEMHELLQAVELMLRGSGAAGNGLAR